MLSQYFMKYFLFTYRNKILWKFIYICTLVTGDIKIANHPNIFKSP